MAKRLGYTVESVERALDHHASDGLIKGWVRHPSIAGRWLSDTHNGETFELRSLREAYLFVYGLGSASQAMKRKAVSGVHTA